MTNEEIIAENEKIADALLNFYIVSEDEATHKKKRLVVYSANPNEFRNKLLEALDKARVEGREEGFATGWDAGLKSKEMSALAKKQEQVRKLKEVLTFPDDWGFPEKGILMKKIDEIFSDCAEKDKA